MTIFFDSLVKKNWFGGRCCWWRLFANPRHNWVWESCFSNFTSNITVWNIDCFPTYTFIKKQKFQPLRPGSQLINLLVTRILFRRWQSHGAVISSWEIATGRTKTVFADISKTYQRIYGLVTMSRFARRIEIPIHSFDNCSVPGLSKKTTKS